MRAFIALFSLCLSLQVFAVGAQSTDQFFVPPTGCCKPTNPNFASFCAGFNTPTPGMDRYGRCVQAMEGGSPMCTWEMNDAECGGDTTQQDNGEICCAPKDPNNASAVTVCNQVNQLTNASQKKKKCESTNQLCVVAPANSPMCKPKEETNGEGCCAPRNPQDSSAVNLCGTINAVTSLQDKKWKCDGASQLCQWAPLSSPLCKETQDPTSSDEATCCVPKDSTNPTAVTLCSQANSLTNLAEKKRKCDNSNYLCQMVSSSSPLCKKDDGNQCPEGQLPYTMENGLRGCCERDFVKYDMEGKMCADFGGIPGILSVNPPRPICCLKKDDQGPKCPEGQQMLMLPTGPKCCEQNKIRYGIEARLCEERGGFSGYATVGNSQQAACCIEKEIGPSTGGQSTGGQSTGGATTQTGGQTSGGYVPPRDTTPIKTTPKETTPIKTSPVLGVPVQSVPVQTAPTGISPAKGGIRAIPFNNPTPIRRSN